MKERNSKKLPIAASIAGALLVPLTIACGKDGEVKGGKIDTQVPQATATLTTPTVEATSTPENKLEQIKTPFFSDYDFGSIGRGVENSEYMVEVMFPADPEQYPKPPFYNYSQGYSYATFYDEYDNPHLLSPVAQEFRQLEFINLFLPYGHIPSGARTYKVGGQMVAEARRLMNQESEDIEIEEVHYGSDGKPIFRCISQFQEQDDILYKVGETNVIGQKLEEYYFIWPVTK